LGLSLNLEEQPNLDILLQVLELKPQHTPRLIKALQGGIPHAVLNAKKHDEESLIIARAGALGAVTIATNMAGRGVDIRLGGELPDEVLQDTIRVLVKAGVPDPYDMTNEERRQALLKIAPEEYGIYEEAVRAFLQYLEDMVSVRALGGLHVIGSERHEARRIDNQLRGRAARQGDPGSSRFYLSMEDELMRLFGGVQGENLMRRLNLDEMVPIESGVLGRLVEQSQTRVEGSNFDVRKHLLEYDDVLNTQRKRIYGQRDLVFTKDDLSEDVLEMLDLELKERVPANLKDEEGPWKLLGFLEQIQPSWLLPILHLEPAAGGYPTPHETGCSTAHSPAGCHPKPGSRFLRCRAGARSTQLPHHAGAHHRKPGDPAQRAPGITGKFSQRPARRQGGGRRSSPPAPLTGGAGRPDQRSAHSTAPDPGANPLTDGCGPSCGRTIAPPD
jgi:hypothetical protein